MPTPSTPDWDPAGPDVTRDQRAAYDTLRERCPVAHSEFFQWSVFRHADVMRVLLDHESFSNAVSTHLSVPSGMDPPEHTAYRRIIEPYFSAERVGEFEPRCRAIVAALIDQVLAVGEVEWMAAFSLPFAVRVQCDFLGWSSALHEPLVSWTRRNYAATLAQDRAAMAAIAREFEGIVDDILAERADAAPDEDLTAALMHEKVWGRPLTNEEMASILRNWTVGEVGTIAASIGILMHALVADPALLARLRTEPGLLPVAIDEILRAHGPLVANRRVAKRAVELGGRPIAAGERLSLNWVAANRDPRVFPEPDRVRFDRDPQANLLYGAGIHVCPGAPLARMEMRVVMEEVLARLRELAFLPADPPTLAVYPGSGYARLPLRVG